MDADESQFESGYETDAPAETPEPSVNEPETKTPEPEAKAAEAIDPVKQLLDRIEKLEGRTRNAEGHIGGLNHQQKLLQESVQAAAKAATQQVSDAPTQAQVKEAIANPQEWESLKNDFPEWATATERFMDAKLAAIQPSAVDPAAIEKIVSERIAGQSASVRKEIIDASLDAVFPGWADDVKTPQFAEWIKAQPEETQALAASDHIRDAARMLKLYEQAKNAPKPAENVSTRQKRLEAAITPRGTGGHAAGRSENDDFEAGYSG